MIRSEDIRDRVRDIDEYLLNKYKECKTIEKRDGTGYSLSIKKHYASETQKRKDKAKEYSGTKAFVYSFKLMDLESKIYVAFGMSSKSEKEAFDKAMEMEGYNGRVCE